MPWEPPKLDTDPDAVTSRVLDAMADKMPDWEAVDGAPEVVLAEEIGRETALTNTIAAEFIELAVAGFGETGFQFPAYLGATATLPVDLAITDPGPNTVVPDGFTVVGVNAAGVEVAFILAGEATATVSPLPVTLTATEPGDYANTVPAGQLTVVTSTSNVVDATATSPSTGGADPEDLTDYLDRLVDYLATLRPGGVRADDLASLARSVPGVARAIGVDLYDPANPTVPSERTATVFPVDESGVFVPPAVREQLQAQLEASREVNFIIHIASPTYTRVQVQYTAVSDPGADPATVASQIDAAVLQWLSNWGSAVGNPDAWTDTPVVRYLELAHIVGDVDGVHHVATLTINGQAGDLQLTGPAPMPTPPAAPDAPSTCTGTVSAP